MSAVPASTPFTMADPVTSTPARRPRSVRRTTTHECSRHDGLTGPLTIVTRGRDLLTDGHGAATVLDACELEVVAEFKTGLVASLHGDPADARLDALVGRSVFAKFRVAAEEALPGEGSSSSVRFQLLDDLPTAVMLSGRVYRVAGIPLEMDRSGRADVTDICTGWAAGASASTTLEATGVAPLQIGPVAPVVEAGDDPLAWHELQLLPPHSTRRRRRLDVWEDDVLARVDAFFRDSHVDEHRVETVVHEWRVHAAVDPETRKFVSSDAEMGPLPFVECPGAGASAGRLVGVPVDGLRRTVRKSFVGPTTCTHLNDTLRSFEDVGALLAALRTAGAG